ncbi:hypothetical protein L21SP5_02742 [Salinivirga cyanobacteriivorans]|uniref:Secretion system C-terminal sorting domain-containing protein n=1 Tax=Salinivirga cyanobacteriivorans TaxID=1307839 RepID=A0A0S2I247_9BACT|nr:T9SS type A sorting domain-containing protein [Salinivirga cyanobacteriivorans]ALO16365.1 hypothetical protein L21SP5_02742 [Salinivirga cyanobacteriivorans]
MLLKKITLLIAIAGTAFNLLSQESITNSKFDQEIIQSQNSDELPKMKARASSAMRLDSSIEQSYYDVTGQFVNEEKNVFGYDDDNNLTLWLHYTVDEVTGDWINDMKSEYFTDEQGNEIKYIRYEWDSEASMWEPKNKTEFEYNVYGSETQRVMFEWDTANNSWLPEMRRITTYDTSQNIIEENHNTWNASTDSWDNDFVEFYDYDSANNRILKYIHWWSSYSNVYQKGYKFESTYDNGLETQRIEYTGDTINDVWIEAGKFEYSYNSFGNITQRLYYEMMSSWEPLSKKEFSYDDSQNLIFEVIFSWDENQSSWTPFLKEDYGLDASNNMVERIYFYWDSNEDTWKKNSKDEREYNNAVTYSGLIIPMIGIYSSNNAYDAPEEMFNHQLVSRSNYGWNSTDDAWEATTLEHFYYTEQSVNIANTANKAFSVYPNPVSGNLYIESDTDISEIRVIDATGRYVRSESAPGNKEALNLSGLKEGVYIVRLLLSNGETETRRIIKD